MKVEWLANDVAAVTYKTADHKTQQFIGTYGDRGSGRSYYYVGAEIHGKWEGGNAEVISDQEGITVTQMVKQNCLIGITFSSLGHLLLY